MSSTRSHLEDQWILLVDDDPIFRKLLTDILTTFGYSTYEAESATDATTALEHGVPGLAIVDYNLPDVDGVRWISSVREAGKNFPIVFLSSAWCDLSLFNRLHNLLKVELILQKPIEPHLFIEQIRHLLPVAANPSQMLQTVGEQYQPGKTDSSVYNLPLKHSSKVAAALARAREDFAAELAERVQGLSKAAHAAKENSHNNQLMVDAMDEAHKLKGSAGSFGFHEIGAMAGTLEHLLKNLEPPGSALHDLMWSEISRYLLEAETVARETVEVYEPTSAAQARCVVVVADQAESDSARKSTDQFTETLATNSPIEALVLSATRRVHALAIDLSICDFGTALALVEEYRSQPGNELLPVIAIDNTPMNISEAQLLHFGASAFLEKPLQPNVYAAAVRSAFNKSKEQRARVLVVDDDKVITDFVETILTSEGLHVQTLREPIKLLDAMGQFQPDAVLLDVVMPGMSGYDACRMLRGQEEWSDLPILFLTSKSDAEGRSFAFQAGGSDFLAKPIISQELVARVTANIDHSLRARKRYDRDSVTGLIQRSALEHALQSTFATAQAEKQPLVFCLLEIDALDKLQEKFGLTAIEQVFACVGAKMIARFRGFDVKAQLASLFVIVFPAKTCAEVEAAVKLLGEELSRRRFGAAGAGGFNITLSFGLAQLFLDSHIGIELLGIALERLRESQKVPRVS